MKDINVLLSQMESELRSSGIPNEWALWHLLNDSKEKLPPLDRWFHRAFRETKVLSSKDLDSAVHHLISCSKIFWDIYYKLPEIEEELKTIDDKPSTETQEGMKDINVLLGVMETKLKGNIVPNDWALWNLLKEFQDDLPPLDYYFHKAFRQVDVLGSGKLDMAVYNLLNGSKLFWDIYNDLPDLTPEQLKTLELQQKVHSKKRLLKMRRNEAEKSLYSIVKVSTRRYIVVGNSTIYEFHPAHKAYQILETVTKPMKLEQAVDYLKVKRGGMRAVAYGEKWGTTEL